MVAVPAPTPVTTPVEATVATPVALELHTPPAIIMASLRVVVDPVHTVATPVMVPAFGNGLIVTTVTTLQPEPPVE